MQLLYNPKPIQRAILLDLRNALSFEKIKPDNSMPIEKILIFTCSFELEEEKLWLVITIFLF